MLFPGIENVKNFWGVVGGALTLGRKKKVFILTFSGSAPGSWI
jgi:hypothetical protein